MKNVSLKFKVCAICALIIAVCCVNLKGQVGDNLEDMTGRVYCRCKDNGCYSGNLISLRPACYKGELGEDVTCMDHAEGNCKNYKPESADDNIIEE